MNQAVQYPLVSICIPTYNRAEYLKACLGSVLNQDYPNFEVIVCDNESTDYTEQVVRSLSDNYPYCKIIYKKNIKNIGIWPNWNMSLSLSSGIYAIVLSDDDLLEVNAISALVNKMSCGDVKFAYTRVKLIDSDGNGIGYSRISPPFENCNEFIYSSLNSKREPFPSALMFHLKDAVIGGGFPDIGHAGDLAFRLMLADSERTKRIAFIPAPLVSYRIHLAALSFDLYGCNTEVAGGLGSRAFSYLKFYDWLMVALASDKRALKIAMFRVLMHRARFIGKNKELYCYSNQIIEKNKKSPAFMDVAFRWSISFKYIRNTVALAALFPVIGFYEIIRLKISGIRAYIKKIK